MPLTFPTQAAQALAAFQHSRKTRSLSKIARGMGAEVEYSYPYTLYTFDDDTTLRVRGRGRAHEVELLDP